MLNKFLAAHVVNYLDENQVTGALDPFLTAVSSSFDDHQQQITTLELALQAAKEEVARLRNALQSETAGLKGAHTELSRIFNLINEGFYTKDVTSGNYLHMSVGCEKIYGHTINDFYAEPMLWYHVIVPEDRPIADQDGVDLAKGKQIKSAYRIVHTSGEIRWIEVKAIPFMENGELLRVDGVINDITAAKNIEKAILDNELKYRSFFENSMDGILLGTPDGQILAANAAACEIFRATEKEICSLGRDGLLAETMTELLPKLAIRSELGKYQGEFDFYRKDRTKFHGELTSSLFKDSNGENRTCTIIRDISERTKAALSLMDSERRYRTLFEQNLAGVYQTSVSGRFINCNTAFADILGYDSVQDLLNINATDLYFTDQDRADTIARLKKERKLYNYEVVLKRKEGTPIHILENMNLRNDAITGEEICDGIILDITERKKAETMLQESEKRYRQIVETTQEGIWMINEQYQTVFMNENMSGILEYPVEEMLGKTVIDFTRENYKHLAAAALQCTRDGIAENIDLPFVTKSGKNIWASVSASPIVDNDGKFIGGLAMITDITKRKLDEELIRRSEASLDHKNKELKRKNNELEQFAYVASHDLQEPIRTTASFVKLLQQQYLGKFDDRADQYLRFIVESSDRMKILIKDLLDYSRIGTKHHPQKVDCNAVMKDVIADLYKAISDSGAVINAIDLPVIDGHPTEIKQLFQNLTINAIKFRKKDSIPTLDITATMIDGYWQFAFRDNGIGIDKEHFDRIFIIFQRLHTRSEYQGSGIGLSHCKKIVELHHGKIWVTSTAGEGSTFYFSLPILRSYS